MAMLDPRMFDPRTFAPQQAPMGWLDVPQSGGFPGMTNDMSAQSVQPPMQIVPQQQPAPQQSPGIFGALSNGIANNPNTLMALGAGIMSGGFGEGLKGAMLGGKLDRDQQNVTETEKALTARGLPPEMASVVARNPALMQQVLAQSLGIGGNTSNIKEYQFAKQQGFKGSLSDWMANKRAGAGEYGLQGIPVIGPDGKPALAQLGKSGKATLSQFPEGFQVSKKPIEIDAGTETILLDPITRNPIGRIPKNIAEKKEQEEFGKGTGEAKSSLASIKSKMPGLEKVVEKLDDLSDKATYTIGGQALDLGMRQLGMEPREAAVARAEYMSIVNNQILPLLRDTFGAQFTEREGATLRATLGDPDVSPKEKQAVLRAFIEQKRRDVEALELRTGQRPAEGAAPAAPSGTPSVDDLLKKYGG